MWLLFVMFVIINVKIYIEEESIKIVRIIALIDNMNEQNLILILCHSFLMHSFLMHSRKNLKIIHNYLERSGWKRPKSRL